MKKICMIGAIFGMASVVNADIIADAAADYVAAAGSPTAALTTLPPGWSYLGADAANGGTLIDLTAGAVGNQGAAYQGWAGVSTAGTAAVYGTSTADPAEYEIFSNGEPNGGVVGTDLLMHPGQGGNADEFVIVRYTIGDDSLYTAGTGAISGSFRDLIVGGGAAAQSIEVFVYHNSVQLFTTAGGTIAQGTQGILMQAAGTFNLTGLTFTTSDTIDFVVGINGHFGADETALTSQISVGLIPEPTTFGLAILGLGTLLVRRFSHSSSDSV